MTLNELKEIIDMHVEYGRGDYKVIDMPTRKDINDVMFADVTETILLYHDGEK